MGFCNFVIIFLYMTILILGLSISKDKNLTDMSIYTDAGKDWSQLAWKDFVWADGYNCPDGYTYVDISNVWDGTVEGNYTNGKKGVKPTNPDYKG